MVKISGFIIGTILGTLFITVFALFLSEANNQYSPTGYDNTSLNALNKIDDLKTQTDQIVNDTSVIEQDPTVLDVIGGFFKSGYNALQTAGESIGVFKSMSDVAAQELPLGDASDEIYDAIMTIVLILIFIGVFLAAILKWVV